MVGFSKFLRGIVRISRDLSYVLEIPLENDVVFQLDKNSDFSDFFV